MQIKFIEKSFEKTNQTRKKSIINPKKQGGNADPRALRGRSR